MPARPDENPLMSALPLFVLSRCRVGVLALVGLLCAGAVQAQDGHAAEVERWRAQRVENLKKPDGWFSYAGSGLVTVGEHRVGGAADNDIVLPGGPDHLGVLLLDAAGGLRFRPAFDSAARIDGRPFDDAALASNAGGGQPTRIDIGDKWFYVVRTGDVFGWRYRDPDSPGLRHFLAQGIEVWPVDPAWRVEARWEAFDPPREVEQVSVIGTVTTETSPGRAHFEVGGRAFALQPVDGGNGQLFFIFADRTSGRESYGAGRFLYADAAVDGRVVLDFNKAYNPPCALSPHVVCPVALPENRLDLRVEAGEKKYAALVD